MNLIGAGTFFRVPALFALGDWVIRLSGIRGLGDCSAGCGCFSVAKKPGSIALPGFFVCYSPAWRERIPVTGRFTSNCVKRPVSGMIDDSNERSHYTGGKRRAALFCDFIHCTLKILSVRCWVVGC